MDNGRSAVTDATCLEVGGGAGFGAPDGGRSEELGLGAGEFGELPLRMYGPSLGVNKCGTDTN